eukprot:6762997-Lingulodinium_polyedra.AAC.1
MQALPETENVFDFSKAGDGTLAYCTVWHLSKHLLMLVPGDEICIGRMKHQDRDDNRGILLEGDGILHRMSEVRAIRKRAAPCARDIGR